MTIYIEMRTAKHIIRIYGLRFWQAKICRKRNYPPNRKSPRKAVEQLKLELAQ